MSLRSKIKRLNLFNGGDYLSSFYPIITDIGSTWDYNGKFGTTASALASGPFTTSDWSLSGGFNAASNTAAAVGGTITGTTNVGGLKVIDTTVQQTNPVIYNSLSSVHFACYISQLNLNSNITINCTDMGASSTANFTLQCALNGNNSNLVRWNSYDQNANSTAGGALKASSFSSLGFYVGSRTSSTFSKIYKNGTADGLVYSSGVSNPNNSLASFTGTNTLSANTSIMVFCRGSNGNPGTTKNISNVSDRAMYMYSIGTGLTDSDVTNYNNIISTFNTFIGRTNLS